VARITIVIIIKVAYTPQVIQNGFLLKCKDCNNSPIRKNPNIISESLFEYEYPTLLSSLIPNILLVAN
jgi:hypothetical protein